MNLTSLVNKDGTGIYQKLRSIEDEIFAATEKKLTQWQKDGFSQEEAIQYYKWLDSFITSQYYREFDISIN